MSDRWEISDVWLANKAWVCASRCSLWYCSLSFINDKKGRKIQYLPALLQESTRPRQLYTRIIVCYTEIIYNLPIKAQQRLYFLRQLRKFILPQELLKQFYSAIIESVLCSSITVWFGSATKTDIRRLQRTVRTAERIIKNFTPPGWGKGLRKSLWTPHTQLTLSLYCCPLAGATDHWATKTARHKEQCFPPGRYPPEQHITHPGTVHL